MTTITTLDLPSHLPDVFTRLAGGEEFLVTDHGRPVARILPPTPAAGTDPLTEDTATWLRQFDALVTDIRARPRDYPPGHVVDVSREAMYPAGGE